jgi:hypothetical protein
MYVHIFVFMYIEQEIGEAAKALRAIDTRISLYICIYLYVYLWRSSQSLKGN